MIVMMIAITPSLNASNRPLAISPRCTSSLGSSKQDVTGPIRLRAA